jgi:hypothetical protein
MLTEKAVLKTETVFSDDRRKRYLLRKEWEAKAPKATVIMTNPSTADTLMMDYTTLYLLNNLVRLSFGSVDIVNLISKPTTKISVREDLEAAIDTANLGHIVTSAEKADKVIIAWGKLGENNKRVRDLQDTLLESLEPFKDKLCEIADGKGGSGFHPLAPQIRLKWVLKKYEMPEMQEPMGKPSK